MILSNSKRFFFVCFLISSISVNAQYYTGQKVFVNKFPTEISDNKQDTYIQINNSDGDIIVAVEQFSSGRVIRHAYIKSNDTERAMAMYNRLIAEYSNSVFISKALLRQGLSYYNSGNHCSCIYRRKEFKGFV